MTTIKTSRAFALLLLFTCAAGLALADDLEYVDSAQWTFNNDVGVQGDIIVTAMPYGVQVWDAADVAAPVLLSDYHFTGGDRAAIVDVMDDIVAATNQAGVLKILDISDPADPVLLSETPGLGANNDIVLTHRGGDLFAYVAGNRTVKAVNLADPENPVVGEGPELANYASAVALDGDSLVVLARSGGLFTVDATDADTLTMMGSVSTADDSQLRNVACAGNIAVASARDDGFYVFDITNRAAPVQIANVQPTYNGIPLRVQDVMLAGTTLYVTTDQRGVLVYDLLLPLTPALLTTAPEEYYSTVKSHLANGYVYMTHWGDTKDGVHVIDASDPVTPVSLGHTQAWDFTRFADVAGDIVYTAMGHMGSFAHRFDPETGFEHVGGHFVLNSWGIHAANGLVYIASAAEGFVIVDWSDPAAAVELGDLTVGACRAVEVAGDVAYLAVYGEGLLTVDVSDPIDPALLGECGFALSSIGVSVQGDLAATADRENGMNLWDVGDPTDIIHLGNFPTAQRTEGVRLHGDTAYVCAGSAGLIVVDISDPASPAQTDQFATVARNCDIEGDLLHVATNGAGVTSYRITDPAHPVETASYNTTGDAQAMVVLDDILFVSDYSGLLALRYDDPTGIDEPPLLAAGSRLANYPNPFNPVTRIDFDLAEGGEYRLAIFDVAGRRVSLIDAGRFDAGHHSFTWLARDDAGRDLPSGVYFARLSGRAGEAVAKLTLIR